MAVDYPKKGYKFEFEGKFKPRKYPHFMEKYDKKQYISKTALGRVYDNAKGQFNRFVNKVLFKKCSGRYISKFLMYKYPEMEIKSAL